MTVPEVVCTIQMSIVLSWKKHSKHLNAPFIQLLQSLTNYAIVKCLTLSLNLYNIAYTNTTMYFSLLREVVLGKNTLRTLIALTFVDKMMPFCYAYGKLKKKRMIVLRFYVYL